MHIGGGNTSKVAPVENKKPELVKEESKDKKDEKKDKKEEEKKVEPVKKKKHELQAGNPDEDEDDFEIPVESKIAKTLSERTTKIVIILVLVMLFSLNLFQIETYITTDFIHQQGLRLVRDMYDKTGGVGETYETCVQKYISETTRIDYPTVYLDIGGQVVFQDPDINYLDLRTNEQNVFFFKSKKRHDGKTVDFTVVLSIKLYSQLEGIISLCRTIFVCIVLGIGSIYFS